MSGDTVHETKEQRAVRMVLQDYRRSRSYGRRAPFDAACEARDAAARSLADKVVDDRPHQDLAALRYQAARRVYDEVCRRADVDRPHQDLAALRRADVPGERGFKDLTVREQYWQTGHIAGGAS